MVGRSGADTDKPAITAPSSSSAQLTTHTEEHRTPMSASSASILRNRPLPLARRHHHHPLRQYLRRSSSPATATATARPPKPRNEAEPPPAAAAEPDEQPALSRRFTAMAEDALAASPRRAAQIARENEFSADLKRSLEARISSGADFQPAHAVATLPSFAPKHARDIASAAPWTGTESTHDGVLRMLVDAHKPLRRDLARKSAPSPAPVDLRPQRTPASQGQRIARAREKSAEYSLNKTAGRGGLTDDERSEMRQMFRERFGTGVAVATTTTTTLQALSSLADEKIADARRRGQFDNLADRGKPLARDHNAESPFLDTTEYLLNRIIKRQDIVPPWIEKQQEVVRATRAFRERLRVEWRRHAARSIASAGGGLEAQCGRAQRYARGEERLRRVEERRKKVEMGEAEEEEAEGAAETGPMEVFRDPEWEAAELSYHKLAIEDLNSKTRSYNLMAPELAKKPYFSLERELKNCFRDCAPVISGEIRDRATRPSVKADLSMQKGAGPGGILEKLGGDTAAVYDSPKPNYGFKEFWGDLWGRKRHAE